MSDDSGYNGWTNFETWCASMWITNDAGNYEFWSSRAEEVLRQTFDEKEDDEDETEVRRAASRALAREIEQSIADAASEILPEPASMLVDLLGASLLRVDEVEIAEHMISDCDYPQQESEE